MASVKIAELLEKYKALEERSNALLVQVARDEARRASAVPAGFSMSPRYPRRSDRRG
ncbi:hypothetical protein HF288_05335 [Acidithiobacillus caldus]|uniref:hypothetical protein n=1 Tax=Acidithiobacillus caldus TaxID=33059 RepID=UPI0002D92515|nr:hypothetical protein [Acidithiobacillus caldus]MBU2820751.1 hypothetical protein [Acidithiobacillus caldus]